MATHLQGVRVVDLTTNISGPTLTMILGGLGADVVKVERPEGDDGRRMGPYLDGHGAYFLAINRDKRSVLADLKSEAGVALVHALAQRADVLVENFRPGTAERLGIGYERLSQENPALIYCAISAYGETGPDAEKPGYDAVLQARTGVMSITGPLGGEPVRAGVSLLDGGSALWGAIGVLAALLQRQQTGKGQRVATSLFETGVSWMNYHLVAYQATGVDPRPQGASHTGFAPYGRFETQDAPVIIGISSDRLFQKLCRAVGHEEWATDPAYLHNAARLEHRLELDAALNAVLTKKPYAFWAEAFDREGVPYAPIQTASQVLHDPQTAALEMMQEVVLPDETRVQLPRLPLRFDSHRPPIRRPPPELGADQNEVLHALGWA